MPLAKPGLVALLAAIALLALPGTSIAGGASEPTGGATRPSAGLLQYGAGYGTPTGSTQVRELQKSLRQQGWQPGPVDGMYGPLTQAAVVRFQQAERLATDGIAGPSTRSSLRTAAQRPLRQGAGYAEPSGSPRVKVLQHHLQDQGLRPGPADGRFGPRTRAAVVRLQQRTGGAVTGVADRGTQRPLVAAGRTSGRQARPEETMTTRPSGRETRPAQAVALRTPSATGDEGGVNATLLLVVAAMAALAGALLGLLLGFGRAPGGETAGPSAQTEPPAPMAPTAASARQANGGPKATTARAQEAREPMERGTATMNTPPTTEKEVRALGYVSVPKVVNGDRGAIHLQAGRIDALCRRNRWSLLEVLHDVEPSNGKNHRPGLEFALEKIERGEASCLVVSELGRLGRSVAELAGVLKWLAARGARLVAIDVKLDTASPQGQVAAQTLVTLGTWERQRLAERTRDGLAAARAKGAASGRPAVDDVPALKARIGAMRGDGMTLQAIADRLNAEGIPTLRGGKQWRPSSVQAAVGYRRPSRRPNGVKPHNHRPLQAVPSNPVAQNGERVPLQVVKEGTPG